MTQSVERHRLFFALWPDDDIRAGIVARRDQLGRISWRCVPDQNLHATLLFLGNQPADSVSEIQSAGDSISAESCTLTLDRFGWFPRPQVLWLGGEAPAPLLALVTAQKAAMQELDLRFDDRPFRPHVTLYRKVSRRPRLPQIDPLEWRIREFALIESIPGQPYQVLRKWGVE